MTDSHGRLLAEVNRCVKWGPAPFWPEGKMAAALRAVLQLHEPDDSDPPECVECALLHMHGTAHIHYPCATVRAIAEALGVEP